MAVAGYINIRVLEYNTDRYEGDSHVIGLIRINKKIYYFILLTRLSCQGPGGGPSTYLPIFYLFSFVKTQHDCNNLFSSIENMFFFIFDKVF